MRGLKVAVIVMGVLIALGTMVLIIAIARRSAAPMVAVATLPAPVSAVLDEPAGTHIVGITVVRDRLAVQLQGGGADRVIFVDPATGLVSARIGLAR